MPTKIISIIFVTAAVLLTALCGTLHAQTQNDAETQQRIQNNYEEYVKLFSEGKEPDFSTSPAWRRHYAFNRWSVFARENESREPLPAAQTLTGIYFLSYVDRLLTDQIDDIIVFKLRQGGALSERATLDLIANYLTEARKMTDEEKLERRMLLNREINLAIKRSTLLGTPTNSVRLEIIALKQVFNHNEQGWAAQYYYMREKFNLLEDLANHFPFNWAEPKHRESALATLMESDIVKKEAEQRGKETVQIAEEKMKIMEERYDVFRCFVGDYEGVGAHLKSLQTIRDYFRAAASVDCPIAQYHLALFLHYLGDIVEPDVLFDERAAEVRELLAKAGQTDAAAGRVQEVETQLAEDAEKEASRRESYGKKTATLIKLEEDRIEMYEEVLKRIQQRFDNLDADELR